MAGTRLLRREPRRLSSHGAPPRPKPYHPASVAFINHALNEMFGFDADGKPKPHHFKSSDHSHNAGSVANMLAGSKVINRHKRDDQPRLPPAMYDVSTKP